MGHLSDQRAVELAADPDLAQLWQVARNCLRRSPPDQPLGVTRLLIGPNRGALAQLLGPAALGPKYAHVDFDALDRTITAATGGHTGLRGIVEHLHGRVVSTAAERTAVARARGVIADVVTAHPAATIHPALPSLVARACPVRTSLIDLQRTAPAAVPRLLDVLAGAPYQPPVGHDVLAALHLAGSHALDLTAPAGRALTIMLAAITGTVTPTLAEPRRDLLAAWGITTDAVSSRVHTLNLPPIGWLGEVVTLNLTNLTDPTRWQLEAGRTIWVCENPTVLQAAAHTHGAKAPPMACVDGNPTVAGQRLLRHLADSGADVAYHGDFDPSGLTIATTVFGLHPRIRPWRLTVDDYQAAVDAGRHGPALCSRVPPTPWDPALQAAITAGGVVVEEQHLLDSLLDDTSPGQEGGFADEDAGIAS